MTSLVKTSCGSNLTEPIGEITINTSNITVTRMENDCIWNIEVRPGKRIKFKMSFPRPPQDNNKCKTYALIRDGIDENAPYLGSGRVCKPSDISNELITTSNRAYVKYHFYKDLRILSSNRNNIVWSLIYEEYNECGGEIRLTKFNRAENVTTPNYPNIPNPNTECIWVIIAPPGDTIQMQFIGRFDLSFSKKDQEYVQLRDGSTELSKDLGKYSR